MRVKKLALVIVETTPNQLRALANTLDGMWKKAKLGEEVPATQEINYREHCGVRFVIDQEQKYNEEREEKERGM